jgi:hypothetical protein
LNNFLLLEKLPAGSTVSEDMLSKAEVVKGTGGMNANEAMTQYAQGDGAAFEIVYEMVAPRIEGYVRRKVRDNARVEDIVQQTFENMHRARGRFIPGSDVLNWAFAIARNLVIDTGKKSGRESSADMTEENETMGAILAAAVAGGEELFFARETGTLLVRSFGPQRSGHVARHRRRVRCRGRPGQRAAGRSLVSGRVRAAPAARPRLADRDPLPGGRPHRRTRPQRHAPALSRPKHGMGSDILQRHGRAAARPLGPFPGRTTVSGAAGGARATG